MKHFWQGFRDVIGCAMLAFLLLYALALLAR